MTRLKFRAIKDGKMFRIKVFPRAFDSNEIINKKLLL